MNRSSVVASPDLLKRLRRAFSGLSRCPQLKLRDAYRLVDGSVRVPYEGFPTELVLGNDGKRLHLYPECPLQGDGKPDGPPNFLIEEPDHAAGTDISGFLRLEPGQELTLGTEDRRQRVLFDYPDSVAPRHLKVVHDDDAVVFRDRTSIGTCLSPMLNVEKTERLSCLRRVLEIFGGPLKPLRKGDALALIEQVNHVMKNEVFCPRDSRGLPGGLLQLPGELTPIVVADLHARVHNLLVILSHNGFLRALKKARGRDYRRAMQSYYDLLPYAVASPDFCAAHAAPPRNKISVDMLIDVHRYPGLVKELINNRMVRSNRPSGYTKGDVRRFRKALGVPPETPFIVGHTPMDRTDTYWLNVGGADNHHILYSAGETWVGTFTRIHGEMCPMRYPCEPELRHYAPDQGERVVP